MKSPHTFPNRSLSRRLLSTFLSLAMVLSLLPVWTLPAMADGGAVIYDRKTPEVSILNAYSGRSEKLYSAIKGDGAYAAYNGIGLYRRQSNGAQAKYSDRATGNEQAWDFNLGETAPVLKKLVQVSNNLQFNTSATFYNRTHTHSHYNWKEVKTYTAEMTVTEKVSATFSGSARVIDGWSDKSRTYPRIGDLGGVQSNNSDGFNTIYYKENNDYCSLQFSHRTFAWTDFEPRTCTCGGSYAENFVVAFRDTRAPELADIQYSADGTGYARRFKGMSVGKGKSVYIKLTFDEPIRFADDSAAGKGELYLDLQADGESAGKYRAQLIELKGSDLIFKYTVPSNQETDVRIAALGMDALFAPSATLPLKQVGPNGSFSIAGDIKVNGSTLGLSTTTCYITDLAGNPLQKQTILDANLTLDSGAPYVAKVAFELTCNNADVKETLGKADKGPGTADYDETSYTDNSDLYLGVGDSFYLIVHMNERLKGIERSSPGSSNWQNAVFVTNLLDAGGKAVEVTSRYLYPFYDYSTEATQFVTGNITIGEGCHLPASETQIKVTRMYFRDGNGITLEDITDRAGNQLNKDNVTIAPTANANPPMLDTDAPTAGEIADSYAPEGNGFHYGVTLSDAASGYAGIYGSFILNNNGDGKAYPYEWAVTAADTAPSAWSVGTTGTAQTFLQTQNVYFHIRPKAGETYVDFSGCTLTIKAKDYAGNESNVTLPTDGLAWYIDNLAPTAAAGSTTRALNGSGGGTLTAEVILTDGRGIFTWQYAWSDSGDSAPADVDWNDGSLSDTASASVTVSAEGDVNNGELFSKYLWVKATDNSVNRNVSAPICLGQYSYDLRDADYELNYSGSITTLAHISAPRLGSADTLFFLVPAAENSDYYAVYQMVSSGDYSIFGQPIAEDASTSNGWKFYRVTQDDDGNYTLTPDPDRNAKSRLTSLLPGGGDKFSGNLAVTVLAGKKAAYGTDADGVITLGDTSNKFGEDTVTLRLTGYASDLFGKISLTCDGELGTVHYNSNWSTDKDYQRTTLAGLRFTVSIDGDQRGWRYENVDWQKSYIRLENKSTNKHYDIPIGPFQIPENDPNGAVSQTVTVPEDSYESGVYIATFHLALKAGRNDYGAWLPDGSTYREIAVDTVQPNSDFSLSSVIYDPQAKADYLRTAYGLNTSYGEGGRLELASDSGIIYLPISKSQADPVYARIATAPKYYVTVTSPTEAGWKVIGTSSTATAYVGCYAVQLWNTAQAGNKVELSTANDHTSVTTDGNLNNSLSFVFSAAEQNSTHLYLAPGEINTVAVQKVYDNGRRSDIKYYQIMPVADAIGGSIRLDKDAKQLVFTPEAGASTAGATVFAWAWQNGQNELAGEGKRVEMSAYADGTWRCALQENGANYEVITVSAHGALCEVGYLGQRAPWFDDGPGNNDNGISGLQFKDNGNGTYTLQFRVRDDQDTMKNGLTVDVGFNEAYSKNTFTLTYDGTDVTWTTNDGHPTGIYSAEAKKNVYLETSGRYSRDYLDVTVEGVFAKAADGTTMDITVTATDALGNTGSVSSTGHTVNYVEPKVTGRHSILAITFNQPVRPVESWAWHEKDGNGFKTEWIQAFPISGNGTWSIQYRDAFGQTHAEEITIIDDFIESGKDYSLALSFSTTDITAEAVTMTTNAANGTVKVYEINGTTHTEMIPVDGFPGIGTQKRQTHINENMETLVQVSDGGIIYSLRVYIDNIVSGVPEAQVHYYVQALGQEFTQSELDAYAASGVTVTGNIRAWYTTARHVTPTGDTGSAFLFTPGGAASHTFTYEDDLGSAGSVTAALPAGLTLQAPVQPQEDTTPPDVDVDIYVKRSGSYTRAEAFLATDHQADIGGKFDALGYVQGYSLTVNAVDASGFTIAVTGEGAVLNGNTVSITKAGTYTVTVTDKSPNANETEFTFTVPDRIDTTPPTATVAVSAKNLYEKTITLTLEDKDDKGKLISVKDGSTELDTVTLNAPADARRTGRNTYEYDVTDNGDIQFLFRDIAGNTGSTAKTISGIDTEPPELTVRWSPSDKKDAASPPTGPLNTNVTAHIDSSKAMRNLTVRAENETDGHTLLADDTAASYTIRGQGGSDLVTITATPERVTVTFKGNYNQTLTFTASAANGKSTVVTLNGVTVIDKVAPEVNQMIKRYDRAGKEVGSTDAAYQAVVALRPSKQVTSANYGAAKIYQGQPMPVIYGPDAPLEITFTRNGTYTVLLNDRAGNTTTVPVTITDIDRTAPTLTVTTVEENNQVKATVTVNEPCTVTWGENGTHTFTAKGSREITFTQNGTFAITATDDAGNESFKTVRVGSIDNDPPSISFDNSTIYVTEGATPEVLKAALDDGYTVWDNVTKPEELEVTHNGATIVTLNTAGQYVVTYTVLDKARNQTTANRFVRVIGANTVCVSIDDKLILPDSTAVLRPGEHTLALQNNSTQPYSIKARRGILSAGQMKYLSGSSLHFDADGKFTVSSTGYYTLLVTTQDRQTIRVLLYVEQ